VGDDRDLNTLPHPRSHATVSVPYLFTIRGLQPDNMHNRPGPIAALRSQANAMSTTSVDASSSSADKLIGLELIRFVCACAILFWHYKHFAFEPDGSFPLDNSRQPFYSAFRVGYDHGFYGVQIFWCIGNPPVISGDQKWNGVMRPSPTSAWA
jgi:hypothetical protein